MTQEDTKLAQWCEGLVSIAIEAEKWVGSNTKVVGPQEKTVKADLRKAIRYYELNQRAASRKMCIGVFGPSQSGKSYLISSLCSTREGQLKADFGGRTYDFLAEINPEGDKESTGLVTRFTTVATTPPSAEFPVLVRLLSEMDVVKILADSSVKDFEVDLELDPARVSSVLDTLAQGASGQNCNHVSLEDMEELREYIDSRFGVANSSLRVLHDVYWDQAIELAPRLDPARLPELFAPLWKFEPEFSKLFKCLRDVLKRLNYSEFAHCEMSALIPRESSIIDVKNLQELLNPSSALIRLKPSRCETVTVPSVLVAALAAELTVVMSALPDPFFNETDLLDFPGYRGRLGIKSPEELKSDEGRLELAFRRGKVSYLFDRYLRERELTGLALCVAKGNQDGRDLPEVVNAWIQATHGFTPDQRRGKPISLFFVLTKFDLQLELKPTDKAENRWESRIQASLLEPFGFHGWPENWDGGPFRRLFWLRNPRIMNKGIFEYDEKGRETALAPSFSVLPGVNTEGLPDRTWLLDGYLKSPQVKKYFVNPQQAWDAVMTLNDGGVASLKEAFREVCNSRIKREQIIHDVTIRNRILHDQLGLYYIPEGDDEIKREKFKFIAELQAPIKAAVSQKTFGHLLRGLQLSEDEIFRLFSQKRLQQRWQETEGAFSSPPQDECVIGVAEGGWDGDILEGMGIEHTSAIKEIEVAGQANAMPKDEAGMLAAGVFDRWVENMENFGKDLSRFAGFSQVLYKGMVKEMIQAAGRYSPKATNGGLVGEIRRRIVEVGAFNDLNLDQRHWLQASQAADAINAFVNWLGCPPDFETGTPASTPYDGKVLSLFPPPKHLTSLPELEETPKPMLSAYAMDWFKAMVVQIMSNVNSSGSATYDPLQNAKLKALLAQLNPETSHVAHR